jgi:hypothetical protein
MVQVNDCDKRSSLLWYDITIITAFERFIVHALMWTMAKSATSNKQFYYFYFFEK